MTTIMEYRVKDRAKIQKRIREIDRALPYIAIPYDRQMQEMERERLIASLRVLR